MKNEAAARSQLTKLMKVYHGVPVENMLGTGTPDWCCTLGWVELKFARHWPVRGGKLRIKHFTTQQKNWLKAHRTAGGKAVLLLVVANDWMVFCHPHQWECLGAWNEQELKENASYWWCQKPKSHEFARVFDD